MQDRIAHPDFGNLPNTTFLNIEAAAIDIWPGASGERQIYSGDDQFFKANLVDVCEALANKGKRVIVAGLDQDYRAKPFEPMPQLLAIAEYITKTLAICVVCGNPADRTQRTTASSERVVVGAKDMYEARCRRCHRIPGD